MTQEQLIKARDALLKVKHFRERCEEHVLSASALGDYKYALGELYNYHDILSELVSNALDEPIEGLERALLLFDMQGNQDWDCSLNPHLEIIKKAARRQLNQGEKK